MRDIATLLKRALWSTNLVYSTVRYWKMKSSSAHQHISTSYVNPKRYRLIFLTRAKIEFSDYSISWSSSDVVENTMNSGWNLIGNFYHWKSTQNVENKKKMKLKNVNAKMTSFIIQNVIELLSIQLHSYVMLWCYSWKDWILVWIFFVPTLVVECICVLIRWYATSLQNQRMIQWIRIRFNPSEIWMSHRKTNSNILFSAFFYSKSLQNSM